MMNKILAITVSLILIVVLVVAIKTGIDKHEIAECLKLQEYSEEYDTFFLAEWQDEMCKENDILIDAPVGWSY